MSHVTCDTSHVSRVARCMSGWDMIVEKHVRVLYMYSPQRATGAASAPASWWRAHRSRGSTASERTNARRSARAASTQRRCRGEVTTSLGGGRARVDSLDAFGSQRSASVAPCRRDDTAHRPRRPSLTAPVGGLRFWLRRARWQQRRREGAGKGGDRGARSQPGFEFCNANPNIMSRTRNS